MQKWFKHKIPRFSRKWKIPKMFVIREFLFIYCTKLISGTFQCIRKVLLLVLATAKKGPVRSKPCFRSTIASRRWTFNRSTSQFSGDISYYILIFAFNTAEVNSCATTPSLTSTRILKGTHIIMDIFSSTTVVR